MALNHSLRRVRERRGWSQAYVARELETDARNVSRWERGATRPSPHFRERLCQLFQVDAEALGLLEPIALPPPATAAPVVDPARPRLAVPFTQIIGREALLATLFANLETGISCTLYGLPGVGKTTLAQLLLLHPRTETLFPDGLLWVSLGPDPDIHSELLRLVTLLQAPEDEQRKARNIGDLSQYVHRLLGERRLLLVIDDVWSLDAVRPLLVGGSRTSYLITTRLPEIAFALLQTLPFPVPELDDQQSMALLTSLVPQLTANVDAMQSLLQTTRGLPLAITLIGYYLRTQSVGGQKRRLQAALERLLDSSQLLHLALPQVLNTHLPPRPIGTPWSLESIIGISDHALSPDAKLALRALSVLPAKPDSFSESTALAVCQPGVGVLDSLLDAGLLEGAGDGRYRLHQTIADYGRLHREEQAPLHRLVQYALQFCQEHEYDLAFLEQEHATLLTALTITSQEDWFSERLQLLKRLRRLWFSQYRYHLLEMNYTQALQIARDRHDFPGQMMLLHDLGRLSESKGMYQQAEAFMYQGLLLARQHPEYVDEYTRLLNGYGLVSHSMGKLEEAEQVLQEGLALAKQHELDDEVFAPFLNTLGQIAQSRGEFRRAKTFYQESLTLVRRVPSKRGICLILQNIGECAVALGQWNEAEAMYQEALTLAQAEGFEEYRSSAYYLSGNLARSRGEYEQAQVLLEEGLAYVQNLRNSLLEAHILHSLAIQALDGETLNQAELFLNQADTLASSMEDVSLQGRLACTKGEILLAQGRLEQSEQAFKQALKILRYDEAWPAEAAYGMARVKVAQGDYAIAGRWGNLSLAQFEAMGHWRIGVVQRWIEHNKYLFLAQTKVAQTEVAQTEVAQTEVAQTEVAQTEVAQTEVAQVEENMIPACPHCQSLHSVFKRGRNKSGTQRYHCTHCSRDFTAERKRKMHVSATHLHERLRLLAAQGWSLRAIASELQVHHETVRRWLKEIV